MLPDWEAGEKHAQFHVVRGSGGVKIPLCSCPQCMGVRGRALLRCQRNQ